MPITRAGERFHGDCLKCSRPSEFLADYLRDTLTCSRCSQECSLVRCGCGLRTKPWRRVRAPARVWNEKRGEHERPLVCPDCGMANEPSPLPRPGAHLSIAGCLTVPVVLGGLGGVVEDAGADVFSAVPVRDVARSTAEYRGREYRALSSNPGGSSVRVSASGELEVVRK